jgi:periplasmic protein TonB
MKRAALPILLLSSILFSGCANPGRTDALANCKVPPAAYPKISRSRGHSGTVVVRATASEEGKIIKAEVEQSSGHQELDDSALTAMKASSCKPFYELGKPVSRLYKLPFVFAIA